MTNFVIYHRVAVADQQDAKPSPDAQLARCLAYIESKGWAAVAEYVDDTQGAAA
jgi:DNA invertase Pin-like site-specific DNA recombinase